MMSLSPDKLFIKNWTFSGLKHKLIKDEAILVRKQDTFENVNVFFSFKLYKLVKNAFNLNYNYHNVRLF